VGSFCGVWWVFGLGGVFCWVGGGVVFGGGLGGGGFFFFFFAKEAETLFARSP